MNNIVESINKYHKNEQEDKTIIEEIYNSVEAKETFMKISLCQEIVSQIKMVTEILKTIDPDNPDMFLLVLAILHKNQNVFEKIIVTQIQTLNQKVNSLEKEVI